MANRSREEKLKRLLFNQMGKIPVGCVFEFSNSDIENAVVKFFEANNIDVEKKNVFVRAVWNRKFDSFIRGNRKEADCDPLTIYIAVKVTDECADNSLSASIQRQLRRATKASGGELQVHALCEEKINTLVSVLNNKSKVKWNTSPKNKKTIYTKIGTASSIMYLFQEETDNNKYVYDFVSCRGSKNPRDNNFVVRLLKMAPERNFNSSSRNPLSGIVR